MAVLRRSRYLSCFYCGQKTPNRNDGQIRQFECPKCEATNYLDENGQITDPPTSVTAAVDGGSRAAFVATTSSNRDDTGPTPGSAFCQTCLKNQHLFVSSLAQYFPEDPDHPDYPELERKYYKFRQGLEQRYPQVCADCEPQVLERIRQGGYTAKTDHLRRMVDFSRQVRLARPTYLDVADRLGRWAWKAGTALQLLWQMVLLAELYSAYAASVVVEDGRFDEGAFSSDEVVSFSGDSPVSGAPAAVPGLVVVAAAAVMPYVRWLFAHTDRLRSLCMAATFAGCWWNPFFVQTIRGFTKPIVGLSTWYTYQAAMLLVRIMLVKAAGMMVNGGSGNLLEGGDNSVSLQALPMATGAHAFAALFTIYVCIVSPRSVRKDLRPLFGKLPALPQTPPSARRRQMANQKMQSGGRGLDTMSDVLDEITAATSPRRNGGLSGAGGDMGGRGPVYHTRKSSLGRTGTWNPGMDSFGASEAEPPSTPPQAFGRPYGGYDDEMDWTPTQPVDLKASALPMGPKQQSQYQSPFRAFQNQPNPQQQQQSQWGLGGSFPPSSPVEANRGPFWYKVPPAPTSIAQRVRNPFQAGARPWPEESSATSVNTHEDFFGQKGDNSLFAKPGGSSHSLHDTNGGTAGASSTVEFAQPSFFASQIVGERRSDDDPGSFLSDMFSQAFTLDGAVGVDGGASQEESGRGRGKGNGNRSDGGNGVNGSSGRSRHAGGGGGPAVSLAGVQVVARLTILVSSMVLLTRLHGASSKPVTDEADTRDADLIDRFVRNELQPYGMVVETTAVGLCAVMLASLTGESLGGQRQAAGRGGYPQTVRLWPSVVGTLIGLAGLLLAGWLAAQMWTSIPNVDVDAGVVTGAGDGNGSPPWPWWQVAMLHGMTIVHQLLNATVR